MTDYDETFDGNDKLVMRILTSDFFHVNMRGDYSSLTDDAEIGPFQNFRMLTEDEMMDCNPCDLGEGEIEKFILNRMESKQELTFLPKLKHLFSDRFQTNYLDALIYPLCVQAHVAFIDSYKLKSNIVVKPIDDRVHGNARITDMARYNTIFCGTYSNGSHFSAYMVAMPWDEKEKDGYILIFDPMHGPLDETCLDHVKMLAWYIAHVKQNMMPELVGFMPRMHVVQVHHPKEFTQNHADYPADLCCNFWSAILLKVWLNFYVCTCGRSERAFFTCLKSMFKPGTTGTYDFVKVNNAFTIARSPDYTMASLRVYTALYLQQFYQHHDLKTAIKGLKLERDPALFCGAERLSYAKTKKILNDYWTSKSGMSYVTAGHADAYERYTQLVATFKKKSQDERAEMLKTLSRLDMFRIIYSVFDHRTESSSPFQNDFYEDFMKRILVFKHFNPSPRGTLYRNEMIVQTKPGWRECQYKCLQALAFDPDDVRIVPPEERIEPESEGVRVKRRMPIDFSKRRRPIDFSSRNKSIDLSKSDEEGQATEGVEEEKSGKVIRVDDDDT